MFVGVALMALPALAQTFGAQQTDQLNAAFKSTSTMTGSGSTYSATPTLNGNGMATYNGASSPAKVSPRPRKVDADHDGYDDETGDPIDPLGGGTISGDPKDPQPLGDAVLPLALMSIAFGMFVYFRRKQTLKS